MKSRKATRMEKHHKRRGTGGLNLISLMDIFTILVFFLLVNSQDVESGAVVVEEHLVWRIRTCTNNRTCCTSARSI